jgi:hypothetical protein
VSDGNRSGSEVSQPVVAGVEWQVPAVWDQLSQLCGEIGSIRLRIVPTTCRLLRTPWS